MPETDVQVTTRTTHVVVYADGLSMSYDTLADALAAYKRETRLADANPQDDARPVAIHTREERITTRVTRWVPEVAV